MRKGNDRLGNKCSALLEKNWVKFPRFNTLWRSACRKKAQGPLPTNPCGWLFRFEKEMTPELNNTFFIFFPALFCSGIQRGPAVRWGLISLNGMFSMNASLVEGMMWCILVGFSHRGETLRWNSNRLSGQDRIEGRLGRGMKPSQGFSYT